MHRLIRVAAAKGRETSVDPATVARVFASYEEAKRDAGRMDMEDVLLSAAAVIAEDERVAAEIRRQYHHFVVDEFQDVSPIQAALLDLWLGGRGEICVVGDPSQTIYSFAGANAERDPIAELSRRLSLSGGKYFRKVRAGNSRPDRLGRLGVREADPEARPVGRRGA